MLVKIEVYIVICIVAGDVNLLQRKMRKSNGKNAKNSGEHIEHYGYSEIFLSGYLSLLPLFVVMQRDNHAGCRRFEYIQTSDSRE